MVCGDEMAQGQRGAASAPGLAVDIHFPALNDLIGDEVQSLLNLLLRRRMVIQRGQVELRHPAGRDQVSMACVFPAEVDDSADAQITQ